MPRGCPASCWFPGLSDPRRAAAQGIQARRVEREPEVNELMQETAVAHRGPGTPLTLTRCLCHTYPTGTGAPPALEDLGTD